MIINVIYGDRQSGKTYRMMTEMHEMILAGARASMVVLFPELRMAENFRGAWVNRFPHVPMPDYAIVTGNMLPMRGRTAKHVYVENIDMLEEGIYDPRIVGYFPWSVITVTSSV